MCPEQNWTLHKERHDRFLSLSDVAGTLQEVQVTLPYYLSVKWCPSGWSGVNCRVLENSDVKQLVDLIQPTDRSIDQRQSDKGGTIPKTNEIVKNICSCHNFFPLSSVQIIIIPACCLLCVLLR